MSKRNDLVADLYKLEADIEQLVTILSYIPEKDVESRSVVMASLESKKLNYKKIMIRKNILNEVAFDKSLADLIITDIYEVKSNYIING